MRLMHGVEKQELMHHFLGSAGRSAHPTLETWCPATKEQGLAGSGAPRPLSRRLHHSGGAPHSPPAEGSSSSVSPPPPPAGGYLSRRQPRPWAGGRKVRTSGAGMVSNPSAAGGPSRPAHPSGPAGRSAHPTLETWCPATKEQGFAGSDAPRPTCRRPTYAPLPARLQ